MAKQQNSGGAAKAVETLVRPTVEGMGLRLWDVRFGSMGANSSPSRVFKNKKMAGQYGHERVTIQNLTVVKVDVDRNILLIAGGIPGPKDSLVVVKESIKQSKSAKWFKK